MIHLNENNVNYVKIPEKGGNFRVLLPLCECIFLCITKQRARILLPRADILFTLSYVIRNSLKSSKNMNLFYVKGKTCE